MQRIAVSLTLAATLLILSACGFQPRGSVQQLDRLRSPVYLSGVEKYSPLCRELSS